MDYSDETANEVRRIARENLNWSPSEEQVSRVITLSTTPAYLAAVLGRVYRSRYGTVPALV